MKRKFIVIISIILVIVASVIPIYAQSENSNIKAKVTENNGVEEIESKDELTKKTQNVTVRILEGEYENEEYEMVYVISENTESITSNIELKEDDNILVEIEEEEGEITNIIYKEIVNNNYTLYIVGIILIILLIIIGKNIGIMPVIIYLITIVLVSVIFIISMKMGWNLILVSSIISFMITVFYIIKANGMNKKTLIMILESILSVSVAGILINILFDAMGLANINIKITENFVNIKELICSCIIVISCGICNLIILVKLNIDYFINRPYKTKSDNIIKGQRSLKL